jgi:hypothetical protein
MSDSKINLKTLGLFVEMHISIHPEGRGYEIYPYYTKTVPNNPPYQWDEETAARILRNSIAELKELNSYEKVNFKQVKLPCQIVNESIQKIANPYALTDNTAVSLFKKPSSTQTIQISTAESKTIVVKMKEKSYPIREIDEFMKTDESMNTFLDILRQSYQQDFQKTNNPYLDCMFLMHQITNIRISLPMRGDNDMTTCVFGMVCAYADLSVSTSSSLYYKETEQNLKISRRIVPSCTLEVGNLKSVVRKPPYKPVLSSFYALLLSDLVHDFCIDATDDFMTTKEMIQTADNLVHETGISNRENSWEIMLSVAKKWKRRVHIFQLLYCSDLDESRWIKFDRETKFKIAKKRAVEKQVINEYCLDGMKIKQNILLCGPYSAPENKERNICYVKNMRAILEIQGCESDSSNGLTVVKNDNLHQKFVSSLLKSNKKPTSLIFDLSKKRLDQLENKSIHNNALLRFRTLFYTDKLSLDTLRNLLNLQQRKDFSSNPKGCLTFDWNCEKCLMSVIQSTLDIYSHSLKICSRIINRKVDDIHALKQNLDSLTEMDDIYDNDVDDDNKKVIYDDIDTCKPSKTDSNFKKVRSSFMIQSALEYYLPSAVLELCFNSDCQNILNVSPSTEKTYILCEEHENPLNSHIIKCFENTIRFFDGSHYDEDLELILFEILLGNKNRNVSEVCKVKTKTVRFLQQIIEVGSKQPKKNKTNKKEDEQCDTKNQPTTPQSNSNSGTHIKTPNSQDSLDSKGSEGNSDSDIIEVLSEKDDFQDDSSKFTSATQTKDSVQRKTSVYSLDDILRLSKEVFDNDDNFTTKLKEMFHGLSVDSQTDLLILIRNINEESSLTSKRQRAELIDNTDSSNRHVNKKRHKVESIDSDIQSSPVMESIPRETTVSGKDSGGKSGKGKHGRNTPPSTTTFKSKDSSTTSVKSKDSSTTSVKSKHSNWSYMKLTNPGKQGFSVKPK